MPAAEETRRLFEEARAGSVDALNAFYERCTRKLLPLIRVRLGRSLRRGLESRDVLQNVLCRSFTRLDQVRDPAAVMAWLTRMVDNEIRDQADYQGRQRRDAALRAPVEDAASVPAPVRQALSQAILLEEADRLAEALGSLPDAQRDIIALRALEELSFPEIAARLGKSEDACRMAFARAMAALTMRLDRRP